MGRILNKEDEERRPHLIEYDGSNPSSRIPTEMILYIESVQLGFSEQEISKIQEFEYFIYNIYLEGFISKSIPGIRSQKGVETRYIKRFNKDKYHLMMNKFLSYTSSKHSQEQFDQCNMPAYRMTLADGSRFYPVNYHGNLTAWQELMVESAKLHETLTARFEQGKFVLSSGRKVSLLDIVIDSLRSTEPYPSDW